jgi:hypothetical protein
MASVSELSEIAELVAVAIINELDTRCSELDSSDKMVVTLMSIGKITQYEHIDTSS